MDNGSTDHFSQSMKPTVAIVRGKFLNAYEMQFYEPLVKEFRITAFGSLFPYHSKFAFPVVKLPSPMDLPDFPYKMAILSRLFTDAHYLSGLEKRLRGFDIVHTAETYFNYTQQCLNAKRKGYVKKVIATVLENIPFNNEGIRDRIEFKRRAREELDHIIALTQKTKNALLAEGANPEKITVISHFVDTKRFAPPREALKRRGEARKHLTILFSGRLETYKGVFDVLSAFARLKSDKELSDCTLRLIIAGDGSQKNRMIDREQAFGLENQIIHTSVTYSDMPRLYEQADIFVAPSKPTSTYDEQYCTVLLEAQASGLPIVTTQTGGIPENIGTAGLLVPPGDVSAITRSLKSFITSPAKRREYASKARHRALCVHDISIGAKKMAALYHSLMP
jgi:glycosyltransferase involved in cell wall biosynthesis